MFTGQVTATITTKDTGEIIPNIPTLGDWHEDGGYEWMGEIEALGWQPQGSWGKNGWDLGSWPYLIFATKEQADTSGTLYGVACYCEGDVTTTWHRTAIEREKTMARNARH